MLRISHVKTSALTNYADQRAHDAVIVMPATDMELASKAAEVMSRRTDREGLLVIAEDDLRLGFIATANGIYSKTRSACFGYAAQDAFAGQYWLDYGLNALEKSGAGLLAFNDGRFFGKIAVFGLAMRRWLKSVYEDGVFYAGYRSHFADTELSVIALASGNLVFNPNALLIEVDYEKHLHGNNPTDESLYRKRAEQGFDGRMEPFVPA
ncbi:hypothetical protein [Desulfovibrio sp. SGI.169]|uniref:hypothetical protein n=1 Tax=Desulfovibrio sp. SGI.169 TaxID=3420561 RepID=UPI003CFF2C6F